LDVLGGVFHTVAGRGVVPGSGHTILAVQARGNVRFHIKETIATRLMAAEMETASA